MRTTRSIWLLAIIIFLIDQATKLAVLEWLKPIRSVEMPGGFWALTYSENTGGAFSFLRGHNWVFIVFGSIILMVLLWLAREAPDSPPKQNLAMGLLVGGAVGNLLDRVRLSYVVDFLDFKVWPIFNIADSAICVGIGLLLIVSFQMEAEPGAEKASAEADATNSIESQGVTSEEVASDGEEGNEPTNSEAEQQPAG